MVGSKAFDWDTGNSRKVVDRHGVSQGEAEQVFLNEPLLIVEDPKHGREERRFHTLGMADDGRRLRVTFTLRTTAAAYA